MENQFFVDSEFLSPKALAKKHKLETDPSSRKNHMEYMPGMEIIESDVCGKVMEQMKTYDASRYTVKDVKTALEHETCSIEDFKALLSCGRAVPGADGRAGKVGNQQAFRQYCLSFHAAVYRQLLRKLLCVLRLQLL